MNAGKPEMATIISTGQARRERLKEGGVDDEAATAIGDVFASFSERFTSFREDVSQQLATQNRNVERQFATQNRNVERQLATQAEEFASVREDVVRQIAALGDEFGRKLNFHTTLVLLGIGILAVLVVAASVFGGG